MKANSDKSKQSNKATRRVLAGVLCGASVLSLVLSLVMPPISQAIANDAQTVSAEETVMGGGSSSESTDVDNTNNGDTENQYSDEAENGETNADALRAAPSSDDTGAESAAQPADDGQSVYKVATVANEGEVPGLQIDKDGYTLLKSDEDLATYLALTAPNKPAELRLAADISSGSPIAIDQNTTIDLAGHKLYYSNGNSDQSRAEPVCAFITIKNGFTLTVKGEANDSKTIAASAEPGQLAEMQFNDESAPQSLTYFVTESTPNGLGTSEKTYKHTVDDLGAIVACKKGYVNRVISVEEGGTLNLEGGMITTPRTLRNNGHVIFSQGTVNISGGYVTNGSGGGWGGGLCVTGAKAELNMTNGVIAANKAASGGGIYADNGATLKLTGGIISGNATYGEADGHGGGILVSGGSVTVSGGYITNNKYAKFCGHDGWGDHGGAGLAANNGANVTISGGQITGNYSEEAGGGVYVTDANRNTQPRTGMAWLKITGGIIASNVSYRSEGAGIRVGQMVDAMINGTEDNKVYITNNHCMSRFDWGGGGIFVQGNSNANMEKTAGRLFVYNSYISSNTAGGYGGGVAVCPTGRTLVTNTNGTAIFGNLSAGDEHDGDDHPDHPNDPNKKHAYDSMKNTGNDVSPHLSGGGANKTEDRDAYKSEDFRKYGHVDFFLAARDHITPVAVVSGKMLGDIDAKYSGSIELKGPITIPANGVAQVKNSIGLTSGVSATDKAVTDAVQKNKVTTFITGNYSWNHGGGIMSNGDLYLGEPADTYVYPSLKLKATKVLKNKKTNENMKLDTDPKLGTDPFSFSVYRKDSDGATRPFWDGETFNDGGCTLVRTVENDANGNIAFDLGKQSVNKTVEANKITYYLVEQVGGDSGIKYDHTVYEIEVKFNDSKTLLMNVPKKNSPNVDVPFYVHNYTITSVSVTRHSEDQSSPLGEVQPGEDGYYSIGCSDGSKTFTNMYTSSGSWIPKATKVVEGGEMKKFTLEFADNEKFDKAKTVETQAGGKEPQTCEFLQIYYDLNDLKQDDSDVLGRGASKTFFYYVREMNESSIYPHYKFDQSVYRFKVVAKDNTKGGIDCAVTYRKGHVNSEDKWINDDTTDHDLTDASTPTFTNTYSTSLPLSGMSGVTLTYLAGAAVLCAAAAWMHIRRKANAKGGERRE